MLPRLAALALAALSFAACSSNDPEDVVLPNREALVSRYGTLAPGTFHVWHPRAGLNFRGTEMKPGLVDPTLRLISRPESMVAYLLSDALVAVDSVGDFGWSGSYNGPEGPHNCTGMLYILESTPTLLRAVFAGRCGEVDPLSGPRNFQLLEGGFAYVR